MSRLAFQMVLTVAVTSSLGEATCPSLAQAQPSIELRADAPAPAYRWSNDVSPDPYDQADVAEKSVYFRLAGEARVFPAGGPHGLLLHVDHMFDFDADGIGDEDTFRIGLNLAEVGYAYRHVVAGPLQPDWRAWTFTAHAGFVAGGAKAEHDSAGIPLRSPVVGGEIGGDVSLHVSRFFFGWSIGYQLLHHTQGTLHRSNILTWNAIPLMRVGIDLGPRVQDLAR